MFSTKRDDGLTADPIGAIARQAADKSGRNGKQRPASREEDTLMAQNSEPTLLDKATDAVKAGYRKIVPDADELRNEQSSDSAGIRENLRQADEVHNYLNSASMPVISLPSSKPSTTELIHPTGRYGDRPGEARLSSEGDIIKPSVASQVVPREVLQRIPGTPEFRAAKAVAIAMPKVSLPSYDEGGDVPEDQIAKVHEGERVLSPEEAAAYREAQALPVASPRTVPGLTPIAAPESKPQDAAPEAKQNEAPAPLISAPEAKPEPMTQGSVLGKEWLKRMGVKPAETTIEDVSGEGKTTPPPEGTMVMRDAGVPKIDTGNLPVLGQRTAPAGFTPILTPGDMHQEKEAGALIPEGETSGNVRDFKIADLKQQRSAALALRTPAGQEDADRIALQIQDLQKTPWSDRSTLSKIGRIGEMVASRTPFGISAIASTIPGSEGYQAAQRRGTLADLEKVTPETTARAAVDAKEEKEGTPEQQLIKANTELRAAYATGVPAKIKAAQDKVSDITSAARVGKNDQKDTDLKQQYKDAEDTYDKAKQAGDQAGMDSAQQTMGNISKAYAMGLAKPETQEKNKLDYQATIAKVAKAKTGSVDPSKLNETLDAAVKRGVITADEAANAKAYQLANQSPVTNIQVSGAEAQNKANIAKAGKYYSYVDDNGKTQVATGDKVPPAYEADATPIKDLSTYMNEAETGNVVQQALNRIHEDVDKHPELFDNASARNVIATTTEQIDRASAGILVAGTGGSIPLPSGLGDMINTGLQNNTFDKNTSAAVKQYIADYKAMKDKAMVLQMELQNGKIGRGNAQAFKSITDQIPGGNTPDSKTARRQMENLQQVQDDVMGRYPDERGGYKKEKPYQYGGTTPAGATDEVVKDGKVVGHVVVENGKKKFKAVE